MEALAVTHLRTATSHNLCSVSLVFLEQHIQPTVESLLLGEGRCSQNAEGLHCIIHLGYPSPATEAAAGFKFGVKSLAFKAFIMKLSLPAIEINAVHNHVLISHR